MDETDKVWTEAGDLQPSRADRMSFPRPLVWLVRWTKMPRITGNNRSFLSRSFGYRKVELLVAFVIIYLVYRRQLYIVLFAMDTKALPAARDVCTQWRMQTGRSPFSWAYTMLQRCLVVSVEKELDILATATL